MIRPVRAADVPAMLDVYRPYVRDTSITFEYETPSGAEFSDRVAAVTEKFPWLVYERSGKVLGYAYAGPFHPRAAYQWNAELSVYLAPECRGRGIGGAFYTVLLRLLEAQGYLSVFGIVTVPNARSEALHRSLGFREVCRIPDAGYKREGWHGVVWYRRELNAFPERPEPPKPFSALDAGFVAEALGEAERKIPLQGSDSSAPASAAGAGSSAMASSAAAGADCNRSRL